MDGLLVLALSPEDFSPEALPLSSPRYSTAELSEREDLRRQGDRELITQLLTTLQTSAHRALPLASTPISIPGLSLLGQWVDVFSKAINHAAFLSWADRRQLAFATLQVRNGALLSQTSATSSLHRFTLADTSGWWKVANPIIFIAQLLDPAELGIPYRGDRVSGSVRVLSLDRVLAFHGYPMPANRLQAQVIVEELRAGDAFPSIDNVGRSLSLIHAERLNQQLDFEQLADAMQALTPFEGFALFGARLQLTSDSLLARTLKEAAQHLSVIIEDDSDEGVHAASGTYYFDHARDAICVLPTQENRHTHAYELRPENPGTRWYILRGLAEKLDSHIYPDHSLSLAACLQVYGIERAATQNELTALIGRLRQWPMPPAPTLHAAARSLDERNIFNRFIGLLNDRHFLREALFRMVNSGTLTGPHGLGAIIETDAEALPAELLPAHQQLLSLVQQPEFVAIRLQQRIDPDSHVLLSVENGLGAKDLDGHWKSLSAAVMAQPRLAPMVRQLLPVAARSGGELRTNNTISLRQALRLYNIALPTTLAAARLTAQRRAISVPHPLYESNYWRALTPANASQPVGWTLSAADRQRVIVASGTFMSDSGQHLFSYLVEPLLLGMSLVDIRAEADLLMARLIASPRPQQLGNQLAQAVQWQGSEASMDGGHRSRSALVWVALILSLDPVAGAHPARINGFDWTAPYFWGESVAFVRLQLENSFRGFTPQAAVLAAHLMLCGQAPYLLVREVPDSLAFLSSQTWVLFQQYATYLEQRMPGSARQLSHNEILYLAYLPLQGSWGLFVDSAQATPAILAWAASNGILPRQERYTTEQTNIAIAELNSLRARLRSAEQTFTAPVPTRRAIALEALKKVYPLATSLAAQVWEWTPGSTESSDDRSRTSSLQGKKYSFVDLYMADQLIATSPHWQSSDSNLQYTQMAERFAQLQPFGQVLARGFDAHLKQIKSAYVAYLQSALPALSLPRREALAFGQVEFFALRSGTGPAGAFGLIVCANFYNDRHVYECFPKYLLIRPRRDLEYTALIEAAASDNQAVPTLAFEWPAYAKGAEPSETTPTTLWPGLHISKLERTLAEVVPLPEADTNGHRIPRCLDSARSLAWATIIIEHHYLQGSERLLAQALIVPTLEQLSRGDDPWADYLLTMTLAAK